MAMVCTSVRHDEISCSVGGKEKGDIYFIYALVPIVISSLFMSLTFLMLNGSLL